MLFDLNEAWQRSAERTYDVCVCGTGPAGITLATKLAALGRNVLLLEGGGLEFSQESQDCYEGVNKGIRYWPEITRLRYFGGTSNHWTGRSGIFDEIDFEDRPDYFGLPGWPISRATMLTHLDAATSILDMEGAKFEPPVRSDFQSGQFRLDAFALSPPTRFAEKYGQEIRDSKLIDCFVNANLVGISLDSNLRTIDKLLIKNLSNRQIEVKARYFVLALGAIENARLLLCANTQIAAGVGNHSGFAGACFMEHLNVPIGRFVVTDPKFWASREDLYLVPLASEMRKHNIGNGIVSFGTNASPQSYGRLRVIKQFLRETGCSVPKITEVMRGIVDFDCPGDGLVTSLIEQAPNLNSRVSLTGDVDKQGLRRIQLDWRINENDRKTVRTLALEAAKEVARLDKARVKLAPFIVDASKEIEVGAHAHQMGTTRMSSDPKHGVVDVNCRVHNTDNLFIAGSSVFSTGGGTNPTLTIVMLALRLADHLNIAAARNTSNLR